MMVAPVVMLMFGYWQLGNRQMFFNDGISEITTTNELMNPNHPLIDFS